MEIKKAAVIGSGVMGSGIAAHIANAGVPVVLLDIVPDGADDRSALAKGALARLLKTDPAPFMHKRNAKLVTPGNLEDDLGLLQDADWIVEAVVENLEIKQRLYDVLEKARKPGSVVSSNTSTIPLADLTDGMPEPFQQDFIITHFFNPPRYLRLLEIVTGPKTRPRRRTRCTALPMSDWARAWCAARTRPASSPIGSAAYWMQSAHSPRPSTMRPYRWRRRIRSPWAGRWAFPGPAMFGLARSGGDRPPDPHVSAKSAATTT